MNNERNPNTDQLQIGTIASAQTIVIPGLYFRQHSRIKNVYLVDQAGITKSNSAYQRIVLQDNAGTPNAYASVATSDSAAVANTQLAFQLSEQDDNSLQAISQERDVPAGTMLNLSLVGVLGAVLTKAVVIIEWYPL